MKTLSSTTTEEAIATDTPEDTTDVLLALKTKAEELILAGKKPLLPWEPCETFPDESRLIGLDGRTLLFIGVDGNKDPATWRWRLAEDGQFDHFDDDDHRFRSALAAQVYAEQQLRALVTPLFAKEIAQYREALEKIANSNGEDAAEIAKTALKATP